MLFDGHSDVLYALNRWHQRGEWDVFRRRYRAVFAQGPVMGGIFVLWSNPEEPVSAAKQLAQQLQTVQEEVEQAADCLTWARTAADLQQGQQQQKLAFVLGLEGLDGCVQEVAAIDWLYAQGVRHISLTWNGANGFASGVHSYGGLTAIGRQAVRRVQQKHMLLDVAHLNDTSMKDVLRLADGPIIASHCNSRRLCNVSRNLTDGQAKAIAATGGVVGINSHPPFVAAENRQQDLQHLADHVVYFAGLLGVAHVGLGLDLNYWADRDETVKPAELMQYRQYGQLLQILRDRGFHDSELQQICQDNFWRVLGQTLT